MKTTISKLLRFLKRFVFYILYKFGKLKTIYVKKKDVLVIKLCKIRRNVETSRSDGNNQQL